jgi:hypothetical protein
VGKKQNAKNTDSLHEVVQAAGVDVLRQLVLRMAATRPDLRRECLDFLMRNVPLAGAAKASAQAGAAFAIWMELEPGLAELDTYGGGDEDTQGNVGALLCELSERLKEGDLPLKDRRALLDLVFPYIDSGNAGMDDMLYDLAYAACHGEEDLRDLAERPTARCSMASVLAGRCQEKLAHGIQARLDYLRFETPAGDSGKEFRQCDSAGEPPMPGAPKRAEGSQTPSAFCERPFLSSIVGRQQHRRAGS